MDIYDILRRLVEARPFQAHEQQESIEVIEELRSLNALGTLSKGHQGRARTRLGANRWPTKVLDLHTGKGDQCLASGCATGR